MATKRCIDPIMVSVIENAFISICQRMGGTMLRTSRSTIFSEARDFVTGLFDRERRMIAQQAYIPVQMGAMPFGIEAIYNEFKDNIYPGDVFILNDPYHGCNHPPDVQISRPIFWRDELRYWTVAKGHQADTGGRGVCGYNPEAKDCWEDAIRIPVSKLYEKGVYNRDLWNMILLNLHIPFLVEGDLQCMVGATKVGEREVIALLERYGTEMLEEAANEFLDASERYVRQEIAKMPSGIYKAEEKLDHDGVEKGKMRTVRVSVEIKGDSITFDFSDSDPQSKGPFNATMPCTVSTVFLAFFPLVGPEVHHNAGAMRPIKVVAREGTMCNAKEPAACSLNGPTLSSVIANVVWRALAQALPDRATAGWAYWFSPSSAGMNPRRKQPFADIHFLCVPGTGATYGYDGWDHGGNITTLGALRALDPELHEVISPYTVLQYEINPDSGGPGRWRGGHGVIARWRVETENIRWANWGNGTTPPTAAFGIYGGKAGKPHFAQFIRRDGTVEKVEVNSFSEVHTGDVFEIFSAGGGGFGDPYLRPAEKILEEVRDELISVQSAKEDYGVVVDTKTMTVNKAATEKLRRARRT